MSMYVAMQYVAMHLRALPCLQAKCTPAGDARTWAIPRSVRKDICPRGPGVTGSGRWGIGAAVLPCTAPTVCTCKSNIGLRGASSVCTGCITQLRLGACVLYALPRWPMYTGGRAVDTWHRGGAEAKR